MCRSDRMAMAIEIVLRQLLEIKIFLKIFDTLISTSSFICYEFN